MKPHTITIKLRDGTVIRGHVITDDAARVLRVFRDCADVVEADSARGEPVAWMNPYGGTLQVRITGLEYEKYTIPLYTAPPAPTVDVNAISAHRLRCGAHAIGEELYPCADCGAMRTKAEGGTVFTVCGGCWARHYGRLTA